MRTARILALAALCCPVPALAAPSVQTIVLLRHGEKPPLGLGQLDCQGLNRALALPAVLEAKFGRPAAVFAPDPSQRKEDGGTPYAYVRPLATIEPAAIRFGLPVDTRFGFTEVGRLQAALEEPAYRGATVVVAWEHRLLDDLARGLVKAHGGDEAVVPKWHREDFDGLYVVRITWDGDAGTAAFSRDRQGLDGRPKACPG